MEFLLLTGLLIIFSILYLLRARSKYRFPEGPMGWPIVGNTFQLADKDMMPMIRIADMGKDYGKAYTVQLLNHKFVILNSYSYIKELMTSKDYGVIFSGRPRTFLSEYLFKKDFGLKTYSKEFTDLRKLVLRGLRSHDTNMADAEELVQQELKHLVCRIQKEAGTSVDPYIYMDDFACSILLMLISGKHYESGHPMLRLVAQIASDIDFFLSPTVNAIMTTFPFLRRIRIGYGAVLHKMMANFDLMVTTMLNSDKAARKECLLDFLLEEKMKGNIDDENILGLFMNLVAAGTGTIRSSMSSFILVLATKPEVQQNMQKEIDMVVGRSHLPCANDKHSLPYTRSVITECLRLLTTAPMSVLHSTLEDVELEEYYLPKGTEVLYNIWQVLHDDSFWDNPWEFQPSRFLDQSGNFLPPEDEKRKRMMPFGLGKRKCIGDKLAQMRLFVTCVTLLQNFTVLPDPHSPLPETDPRTFKAAVITAVPRYKVIFKSRN